MTKQYIVQIEKDGLYPFRGIPHNNFFYTIRVDITPLPQEKYIQIKKNIKLLELITSDLMVKIEKVRQIKGKGFIIDYEYVPEILKKNHKVNESSFTNDFRTKLNELTHQLCRHNMSVFPSIDQLGLSAQGYPKLYLPLYLIQFVEQPEENLKQKYQRWIDKIVNSIQNHKDSSVARSEHTPISEYSQKLHKKISDMQIKLSEIRDRRLSENQDKNKKLTRKNMVLEYISPKKTRYHSFAEANVAKSRQKRQTPQKIKMNNIPDDLNIRQNSRIRDESLKKRVEQALAKTKSAFMLYEKYQKKIKQ